MNPEDLAAVPPARLPFPVTRAVAAAIETRQEPADSTPTMVGHFSTFNDFYEVDSYIEGRFLERIAPGAFKKTIRESRDQMKVLFNHGQDTSIGDQVLGSIADLREDSIGPAYNVSLFEGVPPLIVSGLRARAYGSSFRFTPEKDVWDHSPGRSKANPDGIPERTITEARVYEFGPVTFPANPNATAGVRSTTDTFYQRSRDPEAFESLLRTAQIARTPTVVGAAARSDEPPAGTPEEPPEPDTPRPPEPAPDEPATEPEDPPDGGSSDSRSGQMHEGMSIDELRGRRETLNNSITEMAGTYPGEFPDEVQVKWDAEVDERNQLDKKIAAYDSHQKELRDAAVVAGALERTTPEPWTAPVGRNQINRKPESDLHSPETRATTLEGRVAEFRDDAKRILDKISFPTNWVDSQRSRDRIGDLLDRHDSPDGELARRVKFTSAPAYERAFHKFITSRGQTWGFTAEEQQAVGLTRGTALAVGADPTGGFAVPFAFDPTVIAIGVNNGAINPYRATCRVVTIVGTDTWNAVTATAVVATRTTEAAASTEQGPTFAQPQYIVKRVQGQITASFEMFQDRADLGSEMGKLIQEAKDNEEETSWATGAGAGTASIGVGPVTGTSGAFTSVSTAGASLAAADADLAEAALPVRHRFNAQWFLSRSAIRRFQTLETTGGKLFGAYGAGYPSVTVGAEAQSINFGRFGNTGLRILGYPVNESPSLPTSTATTITIGTLCNVDQYVIVDRVGLNVQFIPFIFNSSALATGQQALYFIYRNDARPLNVDAGRILRYV